MQILIVVIAQAVFDGSRIYVAEPVAAFTLAQLSSDIHRNVEEARLCLEGIDQSRLGKCYILNSEFNLLPFLKAICCHCVWQVERCR